jgi:hypothetical protein
MSYSEVLLNVNLKEIVNTIIEIAREVELSDGSEDDLKIRVETLLDQNVWKVLGVPSPKYEYTIKGVKGTSIKHYRVDALYGLTIFEYKKPGTLRKSKAREDAIKKLREEYIPALSNDIYIQGIIGEIRNKGLVPRLAGIILDGYNVIFVDYNMDTNNYVVEPETGVYSLDEEILRKIIRIVIASYRKKLDAKILASDFGFKSRIARRSVRVFYNTLTNPKSTKTQFMFEEWNKTISYAYPLKGEELRKIAEDYGFSKEEIKKIDGVKLFYAIQTYYALLLKLLAAEVAARFYDSSAGEYIKRLLRVESEEDIKRELELLESGYVYKWYGIRNFLEGEMFSWYLDEWNPEIYGVIKEIIRKLDEYDVEVLTRDLSSARDMFKLLYEELIPREEVRKYLGIYTTPDWLAELILNELGLNVEGFKKMELQGIDALTIKILDPGVGTGTFLSLIIQRLASYVREKYCNRIPTDVAKRTLIAITKNIIGFDIDALAVLTSKTNYLLALAATGLLAYKEGEEIEIPIYMVNSVMTAEELKYKYMVVEVVKIPTVVGEFLLPLRLVRSDKLSEFLLKVSNLLERTGSSNSDDSINVLKAYTEDYIKEEREAAFIILREFYTKLFELKKKNEDTIWIPIIKSHILSTMFERKFDFIVGNPPWIAYRYIVNPLYQEKVKNMIVDSYELVLDAHLMTHMEMATLFLVRVMDLYLKDGCQLGFVMPRAIFSADQHDRFRGCNVKGVTYELIKIIDCENVKPLFYVPACAVITRKGGKTTYPINATVISGKLPEDRYKIIPLEEAKKYLQFKEDKLYLNRIGKRTWLDYKEIRLRSGRSYYYEYFKQGATIVPQACWFVDIIDHHIDFATVKTSKRVKLKGKVKHEIPLLPVENKFIYGVLTGSEVMPFCHLSPNTAVLPILPMGNKYHLITKDEAKRSNYDKLAEWLKEAEKIWEKVREAKREKLTLYERLDYQHGLSDQNPKIRYKVVYLRSGTHLCATVIDTEKILEDDKRLNGAIIESTLYHYETNDINEAFYLVAILNSSILDELIKPMQSKGEFGERDIHKKPLEFPIPKYNPNNPIHKKLSEFGRKGCEIANQILPQILKEHGYDKKLAERGTLIPQEVATVRKNLKESIKDLIDQIDSLVIELFKEKIEDVISLERYIKE